MTGARERRQLIVFLPYSYNGKGPAQSCVRILKHFHAEGFDVKIYLVRQRKELGFPAQVVESVNWAARLLPYRVIHHSGMTALHRTFEKAIENLEKGSIVYFWPPVSAALVAKAKARGLICVREMINSPISAAKPILENAYSACDIPFPEHMAALPDVEEDEELTYYDYLFSNNDEVDRYLIEMGIAPEKILETSFGWSGEKVERAKDSAEGPLRFLFVGNGSIRKGLADLISAWSAAGIDGELAIAGSLEPEIMDRLSAAEDLGIKVLGFEKDMRAVYANADIFVMPTHEEGGPQVTYEAAAAGLPIITTPMGAARLVVDGETGLIVPAGDVGALTEAMRKMAAEPTLRKKLADNALQEIDYFNYENISVRKARIFKKIADGIA